MAQNTVLSAGTSATNSSDITVAAGSAVTVGAFVASGSLPQDFEFRILQDTPGSGDNAIGKLTFSQPSVVLNGPGTFRVYRAFVGNAGTSVGVFTET